LILIAQHGDLRDIDFIEKTLSTKFEVRREQFAIGDFNGNQIIYFMKMDPVRPVFSDSVFRYTINIESADHPIRPGLPLSIASISVANADRSFCITPADVGRALGGIEPRVIPGPPPPILLPSEQTQSSWVPSKTYMFSAKLTEHYETSITLYKPELSKCSTEVLIAQHTLR
jgi:hypothetical protein